MMDMLLITDYIMDSQGLLETVDSWNGANRQLKRKHWALEEESPITKMTKHIGDPNSWEQDLAADLDGSCSLSSLNVDLSTAAYQNSEALLSLPPITAFKQELLSPFNANETKGDNNGAGSPQRTKELRQIFDQAVVAKNNVDCNAGLCSPVHSEASSCSNCSSNINNNLGSPNHTHATIQSDCRFQYVLAAATSIATKVNEETLTYLNQGQSYEIKLKKLGDLSEYRGKLFKSVVRLVFHERRMQFMEREQLAAWEASHPGDSIVEVDLPLSYGIIELSQDPTRLNTIEFVWDPTKEVGIYIKVNCISTEFTPKKHGGEKGVPFRIQVETYLQTDNHIRHLHTASCQVKVFKLKGADRKHKQDREKIQKRPLAEQEKYQCSYDCTILTDVLNGAENAFPPLLLSCGSSPSGSNVEVHKSRQNSPGSKEESAPVSLKATPEGNNGVGKGNEFLSSNWGPQETSTWLQANRYGSHLHTLSSYSGSDLLRLSKENLIQLCGLPDGIRLFNALHSRAISPRLTIYLCCDTNSQIYQAVYLRVPSRVELISKVANILGLNSTQVSSVYLLGPNGIRIIVTDELVSHITDHSTFTVEILTHDLPTDKYHVLLKQTNTQPQSYT